MMTINSNSIVITIKDIILFINNINNSTAITTIVI